MLIGIMAVAAFVTFMYVMRCVTPSDEWFKHDKTRAEKD